MRKMLHHSRSINTILMTVFSLVISIMIFSAGTAIILYMENSITNTAVATSQKLIAQSQFALNTYFLHINSTLQNLTHDTTLVEMCKYSSGDTDSDNLANRKEVRQRILEILQNQTDISNIIVIGDGIPVFHADLNTAPLMKSPLIQELLESIDTQKYATVTYHPIGYPAYYNNFLTELEIPISLMVRDYSTYDTTNYGVVLASLRLRTINDFFSQMNCENNFTAFILNEDDTIFYSTASEWTGKEYEQYLASRGAVARNNLFLSNASHQNILLEDSLPLDLNKWRLVLITDMSEVNAQVHTMRLIVFTSAALALILVLILSYLLTRRITSPLAILSRQMEMMDYEKLSQKFDSHFSYREVTQLYNGYNHMLDRIEELLDKVYYEQLRQKEAQYEALQAKINPHFLYNTLQTISSLAILDRNEDIETVTHALGGMLEYLTYEKDSEVLLSRDLDYIKHYVQIQQLRYNNRFIAGYEVDPSALTCRIHKLLLQPMVENAIKHGLEQKQSGGRLFIRAFLKNNLLIIEVQDNGCGMDEETLQQLIENTNAPDKNSTRKSIGLSNVQERIHLKYGFGYGITIQSTLNQGTTVTVTVPAIFTDSEVSHEEDFSG